MTTERTFHEWLDFAGIPHPVMDERSYYQHVGREIQRLRMERGWTQLHLAVEMGRNYGAAVSHWESAARRPSAWEIDRLEQVLGGRIRPWAT